jgi:Protein of unknown function (DUF1573)
MKFVILLAAIIITASCKESSKKDVNAAPTQAGMVSEKMDSSKFTSIQWIDSARDYGKITEGQKLEVLYRFKNVGDKPLIIESVRPSCGCTVADPPKEPIAPGAEGEIKGSFDSNGKNGVQHKTLYVYANTKGSQSHELTFTVDVQKKQ